MDQWYIGPRKSTETFSDYTNRVMSWSLWDSGIKDLSPVYNGLGISILSTPRGVMSDIEARAAIGGGAGGARTAAGGAPESGSARCA